MSAVISVSSLTKDYGRGRGVFGIDLCVNKGECVGLVGANGAGKTTLIRSIMGFVRSDSGAAFVQGLNSWKSTHEIKRHVGYVPGEIAFPDLGSGTAFIRSQAEFLGLTDLSYAKELIKILQIDLSADLKRMSKGMKQETALVAALMNDAEILIMDEPSTGLDPLMRTSFVEVIQNERKKGKTILMSSHLYGEVEQLCDRVALVREGRIEEIAVTEEVLGRADTEYKIEFLREEDYLAFKEKGYKILRDQPQYFQVTVSAEKSAAGRLLGDLDGLKVKFIAENEYTLERHFQRTLSKYKREIRKNDAE